MKLYLEGQKSKAMCETDGVVSTTFRYRDVPFSEGPGVAKGILAGVCDQCCRVVSIPAQSTPAVRRARGNATRSIEAILPASYVEALDLACFVVDAGASIDFRKRLLLYYVHKFSSGQLDLARLGVARASIAKELADGPSAVRKRISFKVSKRMADEFDGLVDRLSLTRTNLLKSLVGEIKCAIIDSPKPEGLSELRAFAALAAA